MEGLSCSMAIPLLGRSKTWRGVAAAVLLTLGIAVLIGLPWQAGALVAACAMAGDCTSSFIKRRLGLEASSMAFGLDQVPESLLPAVAGIIYFPFGTLDIIAIVLAFISENWRYRGSFMSWDCVTALKRRCSRADVG